MNEMQRLLEAVSFAALKHTDQKRKGARGEPYINHPLEVANLLANVGGVDDLEVLMAAILHDTVEDTGTRPEEITERFGERVCGLVLEVTDDKGLPKQTRKELQIEHAPHLSDDAKQIKLADKISNIHDITNDPPADWSLQRRREYIEWGVAVVAGLRGANKRLEDRFDRQVQFAKQKFWPESDAH